MRLSPWHLELAKRVAAGMPNRDIMKEIQVSPSRLSVLKANPLFAEQVKRYTAQNEEKYSQAINIFGEKVKAIAQEMTRIAVCPTVPPQVRLAASKEVLDRLAQAEGVSQTDGETDEIVFEQMLRVTKKGLGIGRNDAEVESEPHNLDNAQKQLLEDFQTQEQPFEDVEWEEVCQA